MLDVPGPPMIHVTRSRRPEIVLFGRAAAARRVRLPWRPATKSWSAASGPGEIAVSKFAVGEPDQKRIVSDRVDDVIRAIVDLGGTYPDVVQALAEAKVRGALASRFEVDALPEAGRTYDRKPTSEPRRTAWPGRVGLGPLHGLPEPASEEASVEEQASPMNPAEEATNAGGFRREGQPSKGFFGKILGRKSS